MCSSIALHGLVQLYLVLAEVEGTLDCARRTDDAMLCHVPVAEVFATAHRAWHVSEFILDALLQQN